MALEPKVIGSMEFHKTDKGIIRRGENSVVYSGVFKEIEEEIPIAIKCIPKSVIQRSQLKQWRANEGHVNVVKCYEIRDDEDYYYIGMELCHGPFKDIIKNRKFYGDIGSDPEIILQIVSGLEWLAGQDVAYRSVNPSNILVSKGKKGCPPKIKFGDFMISRVQKDGKNDISNSGKQRNPIWSAPEMFITQPYTFKADIFSLGIIVAYFLSGGEHPFDSSVSNILNKDFIPNLSKIKDPKAVDLITSMLKFDASERPKIEEVKKHPYFWDATRSLDFLTATYMVLEEKERVEGVECDICHNKRRSKCQENCDNWKSSDLVSQLNKHNIFSAKWSDYLPVKVKDNIFTGKHKMEDHEATTKSVFHLIRVIRNKWQHIRSENNKDVRTDFGDTEEDYFHFWDSRFPSLLIRTWKVMKPEENDRHIRRFYAA